MPWTTPRTWNPFELVTDTMLNTHVRDNLNYLYNTHIADLPALNQYPVTWTTDGTQPALGNGNLIGQYVRAGKLVWFHIYLVTGSTTTFGTGNFLFSFPVPTHPFGALAIVGTARLYHGGAYFTGMPGPQNANQMVVFAHNTAGVLNATNPWVWATGDQIMLTGCYPVA